MCFVSNNSPLCQEDLSSGVTLSPIMLFKLTHTFKNRDSEEHPTEFKKNKNTMPAANFGFPNSQKQ